MAISARDDGQEHKQGGLSKKATGCLKGKEPPLEQQSLAKKPFYGSFNQQRVMLWGHSIQVQTGSGMTQPSSEDVYSVLRRKIHTILNW